MQFWPSDDEHMCSKHVEAWNKTYCETNFVHQNWLITDKYVIGRFTVVTSNVLKTEWMLSLPESY